MSGLLAYVATSVAVGLGLALVLVSLGSLILRRPLFRMLPLATVTLIFVAMTHLPLPAADMACPVPFTEPKLVPFGLLRMAGEPITTVYWLSTAANFLISALVGALLAPFTTRVPVALAYGAGLSLLVELSQLTGLFGLYPCPWRQFDVDDLILNIAGVWAGFLIGRVVARRLGAGPPSAEP